tara:strand:- start:1400 stop:2224 length:825 start_codon:yes stop_codon:yes gene_type:complete
MSVDKLKIEMGTFGEESRPGGIWEGGSNPSRWGWREARWRMKEGGIDIEEIYEICIKPYAVPGAAVLDIGTNGGFWLSKMLDGDPTSAIGIDVLDPDHLGFWANMYRWHGPEVCVHPGKLGFIQVTNFSLGAVEDNLLDFVFSYDVFCHISWPGAQEYIKNLFSKMKPTADAFIMIADANKYPFARPTNHPPQTWGDSLAITARLPGPEAVIIDRDGTLSKRPGRWYFYGVDNFCAYVQECGFEVVSRDAAPKADTTNTIVHFRKPEIGDTQNE